MPYTFQTIAAPDGTGGTFLEGINNAGQIAGYSEDDREIPHSFVFAGGSFKPVVPGVGIPGINVTAHGIDNAGQVVGTDGNNKSGVNAFLWSPDGAWQEIGTHSNGGSGPSTHAFGINDGGEVVGSFNPSQGAPPSAFVFQSGISSFFQVPGATATEAHGVNNAGAIVGIADGRGFVDIGGQFTFIVGDPMAINNGGTIVGSSFYGTHTHGFVDVGGHITAVDMPGAADTWVTGINDNGTIVGYSDAVSGGVAQGFFATDPPPDPAPAAPLSVFDTSTQTPVAAAGTP
jgi:probable HAF family extracellular repeat protein